MSVLENGYLSDPDTQAHFDRIQRDIDLLDYKIYRSYPDKHVHTGPFAGMRLCEDPFWLDGNMMVRLMGRYEHELWPVVEKAIARQPKSVLNIGCCEGYYAVGFALRLPSVRMIWACDILSEAIRCTNDAAVLNHVSDRVTGFVLDRGASADLELPCLIVIDNEGSEEDTIRRLKVLQADFIVECHDFLKPGTTDRIVKMLEPTHEVERISSRWDEELIKAQPSVLQAIVVGEKRSKNACWLAAWQK